MNSAAPARFMTPTSSSARMIPINPPAGISLENIRKPGASESPTAPLNTNIPAPTTFAHAVSIGSDRTHFHAKPTSSIGRAKLTSPSVCRQKSLKYEPRNPVRFCARGMRETVLNEGSVL